MPGSVRLVRGRDVWELRVYLGRDTRGRVQHRYARFQGTKREAERELARLVAESDRHRTTAQVNALKDWGDRTTINDAIAAWRDNGWEALSPTTVRRYEGLWATHVHDSIGMKPLIQLSPYDVERYFRTLKAKGLAEASVRQIRAMLHRACRLTKKWSGGALPNPIADTELPAWPPDEQAHVRAPSVEEVRRILDAAEAQDPRTGTALRVIAATGMRRGEACALRWSDLDEATATVRVDESVIASAGGATIKAPKTRASIRHLPVDTATLAALVRLREMQQALADAAEIPLEHNGFVFSFEPGGAAPPHPDVLTKAFTRARTSARVAKDIHLHSFRHFHATALDAVISEAQKQARLGWATVHMARHYTDGVEAEDRRAAEHMGRLLG